MSLPEQTTRAERTTTSGVLSYGINEFTIPDVTSVKVYLDTVEINYGTGFEVSGISASGFTVTLINDPDDDQILVVLLDTPLSQLVSLIRGGSFNASVIMGALNKLTYILQQHQEELGRAVKFPPYSLVEDFHMPASLTALKWLQINSAKTALEVVDPPTGSEGVPGPAGSQIFSGSGVPSGALGSVDDWYIDTATGDAYKKTAVSTWTLQLSLQGPQGDPGAAGDGAVAGVASKTVAVTLNAEFVDVDLTEYALADTDYQCAALPTWTTTVEESLSTPRTSTSVRFEFATPAESGSSINFIISSQGDLSGGGGGSTSHDHTSASGDGGKLTNSELDGYTEWQGLGSAPSSPASGKGRWYFDLATLRFHYKLNDGSIITAATVAHDHSAAGVGGALTAPVISQYADFTGITAPASPGATITRAYRDSADGHFKVKNSAGTVTDLEGIASGLFPGMWGSRGLVALNNTSTPNSQFDIDAESIALRDTSSNIVVRHNPGAALTCNVLQVGPTANGRDQAGTFSANQWIHFYWIWNGTTLATVASLTAPPTGPTLPTTYTHWSYVGAVRYNASSQLVATQIRCNRASYMAGQVALSDGLAITETAVNCAAFVPPNASGFDTHLRYYAYDGANIVTVKFRVVSGSDFAPAGPTTSFAVPGTYSLYFPNISQQFYYLWSASPGTPRGLFAHILGYTVPNGGN